jgi:hypothetical protein
MRMLDGTPPAAGTGKTLLSSLALRLDGPRVEARRTSADEVHQAPFRT